MANKLIAPCRACRIQVRRTVALYQKSLMTNAFWQLRQANASIMWSGGDKRIANDDKNADKRPCSRVMKMTPHKTPHNFALSLTLTLNLTCQSPSNRVDKCQINVFVCPINLDILPQSVGMAGVGVLYSPRSN